MDPEAPVSSQDRLLLLLKTKGPMTASKLARRLGLTSVAVHQHLSSLQTEGLVDFTKERRKVGRPAHLWALTPDADGCFPDRHADFAVAMLVAVRSAFGDEGVARLVDETTRRQVASYQKAMPRPVRTASEMGAPAEPSLEQRVAVLARLRRGDGFMTEWGRGCDGVIELVEHHCAIAKAARVCPELCEGELALFRATLGPDVSIVRVEHALDGDPRCAYRINEVEGRV